ncbi:XRE family transcriptional regulator [Halobacteriales archaeon QH_6_64_20]|nr:MAG: XRE family transcriptional regulator [Halobacteriales archaeon QH_6_64_20]
MTDTDRLTPPLGEELRERRQARGLSRRELAQELGVSKMAIASWELNYHSASDEHAAALVELFDTSDRRASLAERRVLDGAPRGP